jgi:hypothetical protein
MRLTIFFLLLARGVIAEWVPQNRVTFSGGWSREVGGYSISKRTAAGLGLSYGYRAHKYIDAESGVFTALQPSFDIRTTGSFVNLDDRFIWVPFGVRFVAPLYLNRIEFSGGGGGLYQRYAVSNPNPALSISSYNAWGGYFVGSTAVALDKGRHVWLGITPRLFMANPAYARDRWFKLSGEASFRF